MRQDMSVLTSMKTNRYGTPRWYIQLVRKVFQSNIDLDPATSYGFNSRYVRARQFFTVKDDGLNQEWYAANVFLNPPYSAENGKRVATTPKWIEKAIAEYEAGSYVQGIFLVNFKIGYNWMNQLADYNRARVIVHRDRIAFTDELGQLCKPSRQPQASVYVGPDPGKFLYVFGTLGWLLL